VNKFSLLLVLSIFLLSCGLSQAISTPTAAPAPTVAPQTSPSPAAAPPVLAPTTSAKPNPFGLFLGFQKPSTRPEVISAVQDLNPGGWVRLWVHLGDGIHDYTKFLAAGFDLVLTIADQNPTNILDTYGTLKDWPAAGFPFKSKSVFQRDLRDFLQPALPYLDQGRRVWVQADNEVWDASRFDKSLFWRGTDPQYLDELQALYETVKALDPRLRVVLTSFSDLQLKLLNAPKDPIYDQVAAHVTSLLTRGRYDVMDLHFYGCPADIPAQIAAFKKYIPPGKPATWISTENGGPDIRCKDPPASWKDDLPAFEKLQARQVPERLSACIDNGGSVCLWFAYSDLPNASDIFSHLGLVDPTVDPPRRKPAYLAFRNFVSR